jgi:hypothetical protein
MILVLPGNHRNDQQPCAWRTSHDRVATHPRDRRINLGRRSGPGCHPAGLAALALSDQTTFGDIFWTMMSSSSGAC